MNYFEIASHSNIYLEDSYVLGIREDNNRVVFYLDVVLTEEHPAYQPPKQGEQYCYQKAELCFINVKVCKWISKKFKAFSDATEEQDYGNIDSLTEEHGVYFLRGDWGEVQIECDYVDLKIK